MKRIVEQVSSALFRIRNRHFIILDTIVFSIAPILALSLRLDGFNIVEILNTYGLELAIVSAVFIIVKLSILYSFGFYRRCWRYASIDEMTQIVMLILAAIVLETGIVYALNTWFAVSAFLPRSLALLDGILSLIFVGGLRFSIRVVERVNHKQSDLKSGERLLIVGAGNAAVTIVQQMQQNPHFNLLPVAFIDDDPAKFQLRIRGLPVVGDRHQIPKIVRSLRVDRVAIAMPSAPGEVIREIFRYLPIERRAYQYFT